ncbi:MAG: TIGR01459 family HAD-type hydrolase [Alphaproteobacteria bacterium]|nr:TIGR01459 family HAD-type hydrolase [Alphaproteobacteria bacterium]
MTPPTPITGLKDVIAHYDALLVDQWAVMHNGMAAIPGALDALEAAVASDKMVVSLSNSSRSRRGTLENLKEMGFEQNRHFHEVVTSGCDVRDCLTEKPDAFYQNLGTAYAMIAWGNHQTLTERLDQLTEVNDIEQAEFVFCSGIETGKTPEDYRPLLQRALERKLPMICSNPDKWSMAPNGKLYPCPGAVADKYETMGGFVRWHGKPHKAAYDACDRIRMRLGGKRTDKVLAIGDSLEHDIAGGHNHGHDTLLITRGIHHQSFVGNSTAADHARLYDQYGVVPTYTTHKLQW